MSSLISASSELNAAIQDAEGLLSITRCSTLQKEAIGSLSTLKERINEMKTAAISEEREEVANILLGYECRVEALIHELRMWILLKEGDPDEAWNELVAAQNASVCATRTHSGFAPVIQHYRRLEVVEKVVFPPQIFVSAGMLIHREQCSICEAPYEDCEHFAGMPYMGEFCHRIVDKASIDHVSIVEHPADKRCRFTDINVKGAKRNRMTWRIEPDR